MQTLLSTKRSAKLSSTLSTASKAASAQLMDECSTHCPTNEWCASVQPFECTKCTYTYEHVWLYCRVCHTTPSREGLISSACAYRLTDVGPMSRAQCIRCAPPSLQEPITMTSTSFFKRLYSKARTAVKRAANYVDVSITPFGHGGAHIHAPRVTKYTIYLPEREVVYIV